MLFTTQLRHEHDLLLAMADELEVVCSGPRPEGLIPLLILLERFNQLLQVHLLREDSILYPNMLSGNDREAATVAAAFQAELGSLDAHVAQFEKEWTTGEISSRWPAFCQDLHILLQELRVRIARENEELYPMAERPAQSAPAPKVAARL